MNQGLSFFFFTDTSYLLFARVVFAKKISRYLNKIDIKKQEAVTVWCGGEGEAGE